MNQKIYSFTTLQVEEVIERLNSSLINGLTTKESEKRLQTQDTGELDSKSISWWEILQRQLKSPFIYLLVVATGLTFFFGQTLDAAMILLFILINTFLGFYQEYQSEQALKLLKRYTKSTVKVVRDGKQILIPSGELTIGDIVILETGDVVPVDVRLIEDSGVIIDETVLTGESVAVPKSGAPLIKIPQDIYGAKNLAFAGTIIVDGSSKAVVLATGKKTAFGQIKKLTSETVKESVFAKGIAKFSRFILKLTIITLVLVILANIAIKGERVKILELSVFAIALAVSVIPEALPILTTLSLSRGALKLAKQKVITKRLSAVEDLGNIEILCTDKTGTITENRLTVQKLLPLKGNVNLLLYANLAGTFLKESLEPFDIALKRALLNQEKLACFNLLATCPFNPQKRRNRVLVQDQSGKRLLIVRGAPEEVIRLCSNLHQKEKQTVNKWLDREGQAGHRVLAVATKYIENNQGAVNLEILEKDLDLEGCISFVDPIKKSAFLAVKKAKQLGVDIKIITGDSAQVAFNVALQIGLAQNKNQVISASDFISWPHDKQKKLLSQIAVFFRTNPEQKHYLVKFMQEYHEVGFLGEGINDSPALKAAGVSLVVQSAAEIARETSDFVLTKKDLTVIINGIKEGRKIFANTVKYLKATLSSNFGNFYAVAISSLFIDFLPMLPIQLLLVNLLSDFPMIAVATDSVSEEEIQKPKKYNLKDVVLIATILGIISTMFDFIFFGFFYKISPGILQTNWFIGSILTELVLLFSIRTKLPFYKAAFPSKTVLGLSLIAFLITLVLPFTLIGQNIFHFIAPSKKHLTLILGLVGVYFACSEVVKNIFYKLETTDD